MDAQLLGFQLADGSLDPEFAPILYAAFGKYLSLQVVDLGTGNEVPDVEAVNVVEGWVVTLNAAYGASGEALATAPETFQRWRVNGRFEVRRK